jgi:hypothetical protein
MASEDLVPRNLPYGGRKMYVQNAKAAGVPVQSKPAMGTPKVRGRAAPTGQPEAIGADLDLTQYVAPEQIPGVDISPQGQQDRLSAEMTRLAASSPNPIVRSIAQTWLAEHAPPQGAASDVAY